MMPARTQPKLPARGLRPDRLSRFVRMVSFRLRAVEPDNADYTAAGGGVNALSVGSEPQAKPGV